MRVKTEEKAKRERSAKPWTSDWERAKAAAEKTALDASEQLRFLDGRLYVAGENGVLRELVPQLGRIERRDAYHILIGMTR